MYNPVELIIKKRNGKQLSKEETTFLAEGYINGKIPDYQMSALLMSIYFRDMTDSEIETLTGVYINSGKRITFPEKFGTVDKHSTGGVGDKITIVLAPIVAACGAKIPMISGRGLGHTGGTLDKLESIPGFSTAFGEKDFKRIIDKCGFSIISQSDELVPADKMIYALRDVTGTVESLPLITASIMSKKIAEGAQNLAIDLKVGTGAFIKSLDQARKLGRLLKLTGNAFGQKVSVIYTNMNSPLGFKVGNALEIIESIEYLKGNKIPDIHEITKALAVEMLLMSGIYADAEIAGKAIEEVIANGKALDKFKEFTALQGGNPEVCDNYDLLPGAKFKIPIYADKYGFVKSIDSQGIGYALINVNAGRKTLDSVLDYGAGAHLDLKVGSEIPKNRLIGYIYADDKEKGIEASEKVAKCYVISESEIKSEKVIIDIDTN
ncbi:MAG: thymidine phosphorylase [Candidatus Cloacimonadota bacterium]|nr:MAG: thymidine phosphorylase [Candidatus Cloacimonadota bacterium]